MRQSGTVFSVGWQVIPVTYWSDVVRLVVDLFVPRVQLSVFRGPSLSSSRERASFAIAAATYSWGEAQSRIHSLVPVKAFCFYVVHSGTTSVTVHCGFNLSPAIHLVTSIMPRIALR